VSAPVTAEAALERHAHAEQLCNLCPRLCHHACPVANAERDESVTPREKMAAAGLVRLGARALDTEAAALFYKCNGCRLCTSFCEHENDVAQGLFAARAVAVSRGVLVPGVAELGERFARAKNPYGEDVRAPIMALEGDRRVGENGPVRADRSKVPVVPGRGLRLYWPGCTTLHDDPGLVSRTLAVMDRLGEADLAVYAGERQCCGYPLLAAGHLDAFRENAKALARDLRGVRHLTTSSPECAWTFEVAFPEVAGVDPPAREITHVTQLLLPALRHARPAPPLELDAAWHDPCYLGRFLGEYEAPREILSRLCRTAPAEPEPWTREHGYCSGGGGVLPLTSPGTADTITRMRVADLTGTSSGPPGEAPGGERTIVSACPTCIGRFRAAGAKALDVVDVVAAFLGMEAP